VECEHKRMEDMFHRYCTVSTHCAGRSQPLPIDVLRLIQSYDEIHGWNESGERKHNFVFVDGYNKKKCRQTNRRNGA